jgi:hypothetical protein
MAHRVRFVISAAGIRAHAHRFASPPSRRFHATIDWGEGTRSSGVVVKGSGDYLVRGAKRYARRGSYDVTVTLSDGDRTAVARSKAIVRAPTR